MNAQSAESIGRRSEVDLSTVVHCYSLMDKFFPRCDLLDYTEGMYYGDAGLPYEVAQQNQINYLLDEIQCGPGSKVLDLGCGNGTLLDAVRQRGGEGVGITISPEQVELCRRRGHDVRLLNYKGMGDQFAGHFDGIVANGSIEHFVQPSEAVRGEQDAIYRRMFELCHKVLNPASPSRRMVTTVIHFVRRPRPEVLMKSPLAFRPFSDEFHYAFLAHSMAGYYPVQGQLENCARSQFGLVKQVDGTHDYHLTSEEWLRRGRQALFGWRGFRLWFGALPHMARHPRHFVTMLTSLLVTQSWNWQFRTDNPPTRLLRQTWAAHGVG